LERRLLRTADVVITDGRPRALAYRIALGVQPAIVENTVDAAAFKPDQSRRRDYRASLGIPGDAWVVGVFSGLTDVERFEGLWKVVGALPNVWVIVAGAGRGADRVRRVASSSPRVRYLGYVAYLAP